MASYLIAYERWPYQHAPLFGYWDSYDDKLAMLIDEPYSQLFLTVSMAYLIWFRIVVYARNRHAREKKTARSIIDCGTWINAGLLIVIYFMIMCHD